MINRYIQIYDTSINNPSFHMLIEKCGSDSVIPLDGRLSLASCVALAVDHCRKNNLKGFRIMKRKGANWGHHLTDLYKVTANTVTN